MKGRFFKIIMSLFFSLLLMCVAHASTYTREGHYRLKMTDTSLNPDVRLLYADSLLAVYPESPDSLLMLSAEIAYNSGRYQRATADMRKKGKFRPLSYG